MNRPSQKQPIPPRSARTEKSRLCTTLEPSGPSPGTNPVPPIETLRQKLTAERASAATASRPLRNAKLSRTHRTRTSYRNALQTESILTTAPSLFPATAYYPTTKEQHPVPTAKTTTTALL